MSTTMQMPTGAGARRNDFPGIKQKEEAIAKEKTYKTLDNAARKALRHEEDAQKKIALEREKENFTKIYVFKCNNGWLKIFDNSAMILSTYLDGRLGRSYNRSDDAGYGERAKYGVISIPPMQVGDLIERLGRAGIKLTFDDPYYLAFDLGKRVSQEEMIRMLHEDELLTEKVNALVMPKATMPELRTQVKSLLEYVHVRVRDQKNSTKEVFLNDVERLVINMNKAVIAASRGTIKMGDFLNNIAKSVEEMYGNATTMLDLKLITAKQYYEMVKLIRQVGNERARMIKRKAIREAEKEIEKGKMQDEKDTTSD